MNKGEKITDPSESFYRRIYRTDKRYVDKRTGKILSRAFTPRPKDNGFISVDLCRLTDEDTALNGNPAKFILGTIQNSDVLSLNLSSIYDPLTEKYDGIDNIAHCLIGKIDFEDESIAGILSRKAVKIEINT
jgi:hypothetical protein